MLKARPDLANEAERIAKAVLTEVNFADIAVEVEDAVTGAGNRATTPFSRVGGGV